MDSYYDIFLDAVLTEIALVQSSTLALWHFEGVCSSIEVTCNALVQNSTLTLWHFEGYAAAALRWQGNLDNGGPELRPQHQEKFPNPTEWPKSPRPQLPPKITPKVKPIVHKKSTTHLCWMGDMSQSNEEETQKVHQPKEFQKCPKPPSWVENWKDCKICFFYNNIVKVYLIIHLHISGKALKVQLQLW